MYYRHIEQASEHVLILAHLHTHNVKVECWCNYGSDPNYYKNVNINKKDKVYDTMWTQWFKCKFIGQN